MMRQKAPPAIWRRNVQHPKAAASVAKTEFILTILGLEDASKPCLSPQTANGKSTGKILGHCQNGSATGRLTVETMGPTFADVVQNAQAGQKDCVLMVDTYLAMFHKMLRCNRHSKKAELQDWKEDLIQGWRRSIFGTGVGLSIYTFSPNSQTSARYGSAGDYDEESEEGDEGDGPAEEADASLGGRPLAMGNSNMITPPDTGRGSFKFSTAGFPNPYQQHMSSVFGDFANPPPVFPQPIAGGYQQPSNSDVPSGGVPHMPFNGEGFSATMPWSDVGNTHQFAFPRFGDVMHTSAAGPSQLPHLGQSPSASTGHMPFDMNFGMFSDGTNNAEGNMMMGFGGLNGGNQPIAPINGNNSQADMLFKANQEMNAFLLDPSIGNNLHMGDPLLAGTGGFNMAPAQDGSNDFNGAGFMDGVNGGLRQLLPPFEPNLPSHATGADSAPPVAMSGDHMSSTNDEASSNVAPANSMHGQSLATSNIRVHDDAVPKCGVADGGEDFRTEAGGAEGEVAPTKDKDIQDDVVEGHEAMEMDDDGDLFAEKEHPQSSNAMSAAKDGSMPPTHIVPFLALPKKSFSAANTGVKQTAASNPSADQQRLSIDDVRSVLKELDADSSDDSDADELSTPTQSPPPPYSAAWIDALDLTKEDEFQMWLDSMGGDNFFRELPTPEEYAAQQQQKRRGGGKKRTAKDIDGEDGDGLVAKKFRV